MADFRSRFRNFNKVVNTSSSASY